MSAHRSIVSSCIVAAVLAMGCAHSPESRPEFLTGAYFDGTRVVTLGSSAGDTSRYRDLDDGESRRLHPAGADEWVSGDGFSQKEPVTLVVKAERGGEGRVERLRWRESDGEERVFERIDRERWGSFTSDGATLRAKLVLPEGGGPFPAIVIVHGSGSDAATETYSEPYTFVPFGLAALVFDKRGTGGSGGEYGHDFEQLGRDVAAAVEWLGVQPEIDPDRIGLAGYSQGSRVGAQAAALSEHVRFLMANYGMLESPWQEELQENLALVRKAGHSADAVAEARELVEAALELAASDFEQGWDSFNAARARYRDRPWLKALEGRMTYEFVRYPNAIVRRMAPSRMPPGLDWRSDPLPTLRDLEIPVLYLVAADDEEAPSAGTIEILERLVAAGRPIEFHVIDGADHGMVRFEESSDGERSYTAYAPELYRLQVKFACDQFRVACPATAAKAMAR